MAPLVIHAQQASSGMPRLEIEAVRAEPAGAASAL